MASTDFYCSVDGAVLNLTGASYSANRSAASGTNTYTSDDRVVQDLSNGASSRVCRGAFPTDTSGLDDGVTITGATLNVYFTLVYQGAADYQLFVVGSSKGTSAIATSDFDKLYGTLDADTKYSSGLVSTGITTGMYTGIDLNSTGYGTVSKTGFTQLALRSSYDIDNAGTATERQVNCGKSGDAGTSKDPYLTVTYTTGGGEQSARSLNLLGVGV